MFKHDSWVKFWYVCEVGLTRIKFWSKFCQIVKVEIIAWNLPKGQAVKLENKPLHKEIKFIL